MTKWIFRKPYPDEKRREAVQGEFFTSESIKSEAQALVREGIQNSLDAALRDAQGEPGKVKVRIYVSGSSGALPWKTVEPYFGQAWSHFSAPDNGVSEIGCPSREEACHFLLFEDFGTTGLIGDLSQIDKPKPPENNPFYFYMRAEGQSGKSEKDRGRWGLGKFVFPRASRVRSFLALTHRSDDDKQVLCGQAILKWHQVDGEEFNPDGWFGKRDSQTNVLMPVDDEELISAFISDFGSKRRREHGLSLLVPWCSPEIDQSLVVQSVLQEFYYPILDRALEVDIESPEETVRLDYSSFDDEFEKLQRKMDSDVSSIINLARCAIASKEHHDFLLDRAEHPVQWVEELIDEEVRTEFVEAVKSGEPVSIRVPLEVTKRTDDGARAIKSYFSVWIRKDETSNRGRPVFIRDGLIIPKAHNRLSRGYRSLVLVHDKALSDLLGDAENPAHTRWDDKSEHFKGRYVSGEKVIRFVRNSVEQILRILFTDESGKDLGTFADLFPNIEPAGAAEKAPVKKTRRVRRPVVDVKERKPRIWKISQTTGGVKVVGNPDWSGGKRSVTVQFAYDVQRGNPLTKWKEHDFILGRRGVDAVVSGEDVLAESVVVKKNQASFGVSGPRFELAAVGFDVNRDLYTKIKTEELEK